MSMPDEDGTISLRCTVCDGTEFQDEETREDSRWGFTSHVMTLKVCVRCRHVIHFYDAHSLFTT